MGDRVFKSKITGATKKQLGCHFAAPKRSTSGINLTENLERFGVFGFYNPLQSPEICRITFFLDFLFALHRVDAVYPDMLNGCHVTASL